MIILLKNNFSTIFSKYGGLQEFGNWWKMEKSVSANVDKEDISERGQNKYDHFMII
mgnify:CR=1 FL=1